MENTNILSEGIEALNTVKEKLLELNGYKENAEQLAIEEKKLEKGIESKERDIQDEITITLKKRKDEIEKTFDEQIEKIKIKMKKVQNKKEKIKNAKVSERIEDETGELVEENKKLFINIKNIFKENKIPGIYNSNLYYSLYFPSSFKDIIIILALIMIAFIGIPCGIYFGLLPERKIIYLIAIYFMTIILICGLYLLINNISKSKYLDSIIQAKQLRIQIRANRKKIKAIKKSILKDKDESRYGLDKINQEMMELDGVLKEIEEQKQEAILNFEDTTKLVIVTEIKAKYQEELNDLNLNYEKSHNEMNQYDTKIKEITLYMANNYEAYIGKEFLRVEKMDGIIQLMQSQGLTTVSEGLAAWEQEGNH
ncbi:hypothetical protein EDD66_1135 [Mobilisporobacter senegalensis]|uniref:Uncharacterized protein n=1 Tax=Mobilisporobacter senegalensis TaxID=1329262 RepID=A0A3N1XF49_9FIRM|nr:hypothetical protein [Mobilisporobacter senegalensis]ROR23612.1 hypothetical protein EDD66_1135 [Mobilisporobacter senegalensis]